MVSEQEKEIQRIIKLQKSKYVCTGCAKSINNGKNIKTIHDKNVKDRIATCRDCGTERQY